MDAAYNEVWDLVSTHTTVPIEIAVRRGYLCGQGSYSGSFLAGSCGFSQQNQDSLVFADCFLLRWPRRNPRLCYVEVVKVLLFSFILWSIRLIIIQTSIFPVCLFHFFIKAVAHTSSFTVDNGVLQFVQ